MVSEIFVGLIPDDVLALVVIVVGLEDQGAVGQGGAVGPGLRRDSWGAGRHDHVLGHEKGITLQQSGGGVVYPRAQFLSVDEGAIFLLHPLKAERKLLKFGMTF